MTIQLYDYEAERGLVGSVLIDSSTFPTLGIQSSDFHDIRNRQIWEAIEQLHRRSARIDLITVAEEWGKTRPADDAYLMSAIANAQSGLYASSYAGIVADRSRRRRAVEHARQFVNRVLGGEPLDQSISEIVGRLTSEITLTSGAVPIDRYASQLYDEVEAACRNPREISGIPTGMADFDQVTDGLQPGETMILSGDPGLGKSLLAFQWACGAAERGYPGVIYELEMRGVSVVRRYASYITRIETRRMRQGKLENDEWTSFTKAIEKISQIPIWMSDSSRMTITQLRADIARLASHGIRWYLVDYLDLVQADAPDVIERSKVVSGELHAIAKDHGLAGILVHSKTKTGELAGSVRVSYDADVIWDMARPDSARPNLITLTCRKFREGDSARVISLVRVPGFPAFELRSNRHAEPIIDYDYTR